MLFGLSALFTFYRLSSWLAGIAAGDSGYTLGTAWKATAKNRIAYLGFTFWLIFTLAIAGAIGAGAFFAQQMLPQPWVKPAAFAVMGVLIWMAMFFITGGREREGEGGRRASRPAITGPLQKRSTIPFLIEIRLNRMHHPAPRGKGTGHGAFQGDFGVQSGDWHTRRRFRKSGGDLLALDGHHSGTMCIVLVTQPELASLFTAAGAADVQLSGSAWFALGVYYAVWFVAICSMAVNWHRFLLRDDIPEGWENLRLDGKVWRYAGNSLLISLIAGLIFLAFFIVIVIAGLVMRALHGAAPGDPQAWSLAFVLLMLVSFAVSLLPLIFMFRLSIKLPAIAVGDDYGLGDAWRDSRGNNIRLFGFMLLSRCPRSSWALVTCS